MSFWQKNDGTDVETSTSYEQASGEMLPIPKDTTCIAAIEEAKWSEYQGDSYINLKWRVMRPAEYANRVIFHKLKVFGTAQDKDKAATADKAKMMLRAIDANCGGKLSKLTEAPEDRHLMSALVGKPMAIKLQVWSMNDKTGNWISAVAPAKAPATPPAQAPTTKPVNRPAPTPTPNVVDDDDDLPF
jgi:hypothetical protein